MFKELPAWGFYIRHAEGINLENVTLICEKEDYRTAIVLDDVKDAEFDHIKVSEPGTKKEEIFMYHSEDIRVNEE